MVDRSSEPIRLQLSENGATGSMLANSINWIRGEVGQCVSTANMYKFCCSSQADSDLTNLHRRKSPLTEYT